MKIPKQYWTIVALAFLAAPIRTTAQGPPPSFQIWERVAPCLDTRQDWYVISAGHPARNNVSTNAWQLADERSFPTLAAAEVIADGMKLFPSIRFGRFACSDWAVFWRGSPSTAQFSVGRISPDRPSQPPAVEGWSTFRGGMTCEDAMNLAGIAVGERCDCRNVHLMSSPGTVVAKMPNETWRVWGSLTATVTPATFGAAPGPAPPLPPPTPGRSRFVASCSRDQLAGSGAVGGIRTPDNAFGGTPGTGPPDKGRGPETGESTPPGAKPCSASEREAFAAMSGSFQSYRMNITISGSCEQVSGSFTVAEWCEGVNETYNKTTARVTGTFTGRMAGGGLQLQTKTPPSPNNAKGAEGPGSCSPDGNGTFSCSGFGCRSSFKQ